MSRFALALLALLSLQLGTTAGFASDTPLAPVCNTPAISGLLKRVSYRKAFVTAEIQNQTQAVEAQSVVTRHSRNVMLASHACFAAGVGLLASLMGSPLLAQEVEGWDPFVMSVAAAFADSPIGVHFLLGLGTELDEGKHDNLVIPQELTADFYVQNARYPDVGMLPELADKVMGRYYQAYDRISKQTQDYVAKASAESHYFDGGSHDQEYASTLQKEAEVKLVIYQAEKRLLDQLPQNVADICALSERASR